MGDYIFVSEQKVFLQLTEIFKTKFLHKYINWNVWTVVSHATFQVITCWPDIVYAWFRSQALHVRSVMDKVALRQVFH
jgi:hypothetical protein